VVNGFRSGGSLSFRQLTYVSRQFNRLIHPLGGSNASIRVGLRPSPVESNLTSNRRIFLHNQNENGDIESICPDCLKTVATENFEADLYHFASLSNHQETVHADGILG